VSTPGSESPLHDTVTSPSQSAPPAPASVLSEGKDSEQDWEMFVVYSPVMENSEKLVKLKVDGGEKVTEVNEEKKVTEVDEERKVTKEEVRWLKSWPADNWNKLVVAY
jgi:hypothetical protein